MQTPRPTSQTQRPAGTRTSLTDLDAAPASHEGTAVDGQSSTRRRALEATTLVGLWVAAGYLLPLSSNGYLLLGIPLTIAFQVLVRRRPLRELFAAGTDRFRFDRRGAALAVALATVPGWFAVRSLSAQDWQTTCWYLAAMLGAACAAFAVRAGTVRSMLSAAALPVAVGAGGFTAVYGVLHVVSGTPLPVGQALMAVPTYVALYFPATFLLEEVTFRGALDAHLDRASDPRGWGSAVFISALWGVWHLPVAHALPFWLQLAELIIFHILLGVPLSMARRRNRNLAAPALAHAVNDAVRNAVMLGL